MNIRKLREYPDFLIDYWYHLTLGLNKSERTVEGYLIDIRVFFRYILYMDSTEDIEFDQIDISKFDVERLENIKMRTIYEYTYFLKGERKNSEKAVARKISSIRSLYRYLTKKATIIKNDPTANIEMQKIKRAPPKYLTLDESQTLLEQAANSPINSPRDYCMITLFLNCGMRLSELVGINLSDINFNEKSVRITGKGNKVRTVYLNEACINSINDYIESRENSITEPDALFLSRKGGRISRRRVEQIVEQILRQSGLSGKGITVHKLRHTAATLMYKYGHVDMLQLQKILGHESISTTEIYTHLSDDMLQKAFESSPLANFKKDDKKNDENKKDDEKDN